MEKLLNSEYLWQENNLNYLNDALNWLRSRLKYLIDPESVTPEAVTIAREKMREAATKEPLPAFITLSQKFGLTEFEQNLLLLAVARDLSPEFPDLYAQAQKEDNLSYPTFHLAFALFDNPSWQVLAPDSPLRYWQLIEILSSGRQSLLSSQILASEQIVNYVRGYNHHHEQILPFVFPLHLPQNSHPESVDIAPSQQRAIAKITNSLQSANLSTRLPLIQLLGPDTTTKQLIVQQVAINCGLLVYRLLVEQLPTQSEELQKLIRYWSRESRLLNLALYLDLQGIEGTSSSSERVTALRRFLLSSQGIFFLDSRENNLALETPKITVEVNKPTPKEQYRFWCEVLGEKGEMSAKLLASQFNLNLAEIRDLAEKNREYSQPTFRPPSPPTLASDPAPTKGARERASRGKRFQSPPAPLTPQSWGEIGSASRFSNGDLGGNNLRDETQETYVDTEALEREANSREFKGLWAGCLAQTRPRLDNLAQRIECKATWEDIVLPEQAKDQLEQIVAQIRFRSQVYDDWGYRQRLNRGLGVSAVFAGESGTGKTMAAEVIANDLRLNLYRIDLSAVVSKYIGETEKNLRRLFDAAEDGGAILFFDEADALFGKRSEVKDSHDRYANIEINYLLQRLEAYSGLAILATNLKGSMDSAFMRRLRFIIDFPFPSREYRQQIWQKVFPPEAPLEELDYGYLAQINLTGGSIMNIALNASFLAAKKGGLIGMDEVVSAIRAELLKTERPLYELTARETREEWSTEDYDEDFD